MADMTSTGSTTAQMAQLAYQQETQRQLTDLQQNGFHTMPEPMRSRAAKNARGFFTEISSPFHFTMQQLANVYSLSSLRTLCKYSALQHIPARGSISVEDLAEKTKISIGLLHRLLRLLFVTEFLRQDDEGEVAHTRLSSDFAQSPEMQAMLDVLSEHTFLSLGRLPEYFEDRGEASEPDDQCLNPYTWSRGKDGTSVWKVMEENGELARFQAGLNPSNKHVPPTGYFDFGTLAAGELGDRDLLVDVGGGIGMVLKTIVEATPALQQRASKCVLQDLAGPIDEVKASGHLPEGVRAMAHSFFDEQPIKGAKAYYLRRILHDYSDAKCLEILSHIVAAAAPDTRILISEAVDPGTSTEADLPMICADFAMLNIGGKERTEAQFRTLLEAAGLRLVKVWKLPADCLLEAVKA